MDKNIFLIFNDILYDLYQCTSAEDLKNQFLPRLKLLLPFSYASILLRDDTAEGPCLSSPICYPEDFCTAEEAYLKEAEEDQLLWLIHSREPQLIKESDLIPEQKRLSAPLYLHCYKPFHIFDSLQYASVYQQQFLGVLTLFQTREDRSFDGEDMFHLRTLGTHFNAVLYRLTRETPRTFSENFTKKLQKTCSLTPREYEILCMIYAYRDNTEISQSLGITDSTLQKHLQNIFRKTKTSSRWELLRLQLPGEGSAASGDL